MKNAILSNLADWASIIKDLQNYHKLDVSLQLASQVFKPEISDISVIEKTSIEVFFREIGILGLTYEIQCHIIQIVGNPYEVLNSENYCPPVGMLTPPTTPSAPPSPQHPTEHRAAY
jgi:hypothetical protein